MRKSVLFSCVALVALSVGVAQAQVAPAATAEPIAQTAPVIAKTTKPTAEEIKTAWIKSMLSNSPAVGQFYDFKAMTVEQNGDNFILTVKGIPQKLQPKEEGKEAKIITLPDLNIPLTYVGEFNGEAQYQVGDAWNNMMGIWKTLFPEAVTSTAKADVKMMWVPAYYLRTQNSVNIQQLNFSIPEEVDATIASIVSDALVRVVGENKMDLATVADVQNIIVKKDDTSISIPTMSMKQQTNGSPITGDTVAQAFDADRSTFEFDMPAIIATMTGNPEPLFTMAIKANGSFEKGVFKYNGSINNIHLANGLPVPSMYIPATATVNFEVENLTKDFYDKMVVLNANSESQEDFARKANETIKDLVFKINKVELKNAHVGLSLSGISRAEKAQDNTYVQGFDGQIVITNLDQISPKPKVDEVACQETKKNTANMDPETAKQMETFACTPRGGVLDRLWDYLVPENRKITPDGSTTDTVAVKYGVQGLTLNGKPVSFGPQE